MGGQFLLNIDIIIFAVHKAVGRLILRHDFVYVIYVGCLTEIAIILIEAYLLGQNVFFRYGKNFRNRVNNLPGYKLCDSDYFFRLQFCQDLIAQLGILCKI